MRIIPYISISNIPFGCTENVVIAAFGAPHRKTSNRLKQLELVYDEYTFRLSAETGTLVEVTVSSEYFEIENCMLPWSKHKEIAFVELGFAIAKLDQESFCVHGFFVSPLFGIAFDPHSPPYLTIFSSSELAAWKGFTDGRVT